MGFLDELLEKAAGTATGSQGQPGGLVEGVMDLLTNRETGGLEGLMQAFNQKGLGEVISSWVGTGNNAAITQEQIQEVLGSDVVQKLAQKSGVSLDAVKAQLTELLPGLIDKLTPEGKIPEGGLIDKGAELLQAVFSQK